MVSEKVLQEYIDKCDLILATGNEAAANKLVTEILAVFSSYFNKLKSQLTRYEFFSAVTVGSRTLITSERQDDLTDLRLLRARLNSEMHKAMEERTMMNSQNTVNIQGNAANVQIQQGADNSSQSQRGLDFEEAQKVINKILSYQSKFVQEFGDQSQELEQALDDATAAIKEKEPTHLKKAWDTIKSLAESVAGSLIATKIVELMNHTSFTL